MQILQRACVIGMAMMLTCLGSAQDPKQAEAEGFSLTGSIGLFAVSGQLAQYEVDPYAPSFDLAGPARTGTSARIGCVYWTSPTFGLSADLFVLRAPPSAIDRNDLFHMGAGYRPAHGGGSIVTSYALENGHWWMYTALLGISTRIAKGPDAFVHFGLGVSMLKSPECVLHQWGYYWNIISPEHEPWASATVQPSMQAYGPVARIGLSADPRITDHLRATIGLDLYMSAYRFEGDWRYYTGEGGTDGMEHYQGSSHHTLSEQAFVALLQVGLRYDL